MSPTIAPVQNPELTAGVGEKPSKGEEQDSKKPRRSERISSQPQTTPLDQKTHLPSPLTHREHTDFDDHHEATASPPDGRPSQIRHRTPTSNSSPPHPGLSSPPNDTQAYSQFVCPPIPLSHEVKDEEAEGVWGYLVPIDSVFGDTLVMRKRVSCPAPFPEGGFGRGSTKRAQGICPGKSYVQEELNYEANKRALGFPAGGYLIGRHPECGQMLLQREVFHRRYADQWADRVLALPTISNRHCIIFNENKDGKSVAILEDLSTNGTFVNEAIVGRNKRRELDHADQISVLDQARFMFYYPSNRERNAFRQQYRILHQLGKGHFATVHLCVERCTGMQFAVKKFEKRPGDDRSRTEGLQQEIGVLKSVSHPNMLCLKDCFDEDDGVYVVLELAPEGELFNYIVMKQKLTEEQARKVFVQLFQGIKYLHDRNIVHRDIKPENILLADKNLSVKIADFGLAKIIGEESFTTTLCGTPSYVAPEILENTRHRKYSKAVDIWSLGVVLYICLCGFPPFSDELRTPENPYNLAQQIKMGRFDYPSPYWDSVGDPALDLIDRMLTVDVYRRITVDECLEHPWLTQRLPDPAASMDSTDGITGAMGNLDFSKRKMARERTLLSTINDVKLAKVVEIPGEPVPVKIFEKNREGKQEHRSPPENGAQARTNGHAARKEEGPAAHRPAEVFMELGGKGDPPLFEHDAASRYEADEVPH